MNKKKNINIFIVEDNEVFRKALKINIEGSFTNMPVKIHDFETGELCMDRFKREMPEMVILDYRLNNKDAGAANGIMVLDWIKKENPETTVIMLTSEDHVNIIVESFKHGASDYVVKSETQFKKINNSLLNIFRILEAKAETRKFMNITIIISICFVLMLIAVFVKEMYYPATL